MITTSSRRIGRLLFLAFVVSLGACEMDGEPVVARQAESLTGSLAPFECEGGVECYNDCLATVGDPSYCCAGAGGTVQSNGGCGFFDGFGSAFTPGSFVDGTRLRRSARSVMRRTKWPRKKPETLSRRSDRTAATRPV